MRPLWIVLLVAAALAGCADDTDVPDEDDPVLPEEPEEEQDPQVESGEGSIPAAAGPFALGAGGVEFNVGENVTLLHAEIEWDDEVQDINLALSSPDAGDTGGARNYDHVAEGGAPGDPDSPHSLTLSGGDVVPGAWSASAFANGGAAGVDYRISVTLFFGETEVPEGYTAL